MSMDVIISREPEDLDLSQYSENIEELITNAASTCGKLYGVEKGEVSITLTNNEYIHKLNREYRDIDRPEPCKRSGSCPLFRLLSRRPWAARR